VALPDRAQKQLAPDDEIPGAEIAPSIRARKNYPPTDKGTCSMNVREVIETARKAITRQCETAQQEAERLNREVAILEKYDVYRKKISECEEAVQGVKQHLDEFCQRDFIGAIALALHNGTPHALLQMGPELALGETLRRHKGEIVSRYQLITLTQQQAELEAFTAKNVEVLRRYGAI
jgi:hypothetical protein